MDKTVFRGLRIDPKLDAKVVDAAEERGMNVSEFVRYALNIFFDQDVDSEPHNPADNTDPCQN